MFGSVFHYDIPKYLLVRTKHICDLQTEACSPSPTALKAGVWVYIGLVVLLFQEEILQLDTAREEERPHSHTRLKFKLDSEISELLKGADFAEQYSGDLTPHLGPSSRPCRWFTRDLLNCICFTFFITGESHNWPWSFRHIYRTFYWHVITQQST